MLIFLPILIAIVATSLIFFVPIQHDYALYIVHWQQYLQTGHPYLFNNQFNGNAYGPLYLLFAYMYQIAPLLPKLIFVLAWVATAMFIWQISQSYKLDKSLKTFIFLSLFLNPFFYILFSVYGINEIILSCLLVAGIWQLSLKKDSIGGISIGLGILFKFIPIFLLPFISIEKKSIRSQFLISSLLVTLVGYLVSYILWSHEIFAPFIYAIQRPSSFLSIFNFFQSTLKIDLGGLSFPLLIASLLLLFILHLKKQFSIITISLLVLTTVFSLLKVSNLQYQTSIILLLILWIILHYKKSSSFVIPILYIVFYSVISIAYFFLNQFRGEWQWIRDLIGFPAFAMSILLMAYLISTNISLTKTTDK